MPAPDPEAGSLSKYQTNDLYKIIESSDIQVSDFELAKLIRRPPRPMVSRIPVTVIRHPATGSFFDIAIVGDGRFGGGEFATRNRVGNSKTENQLFNRIWQFVARSRYWDEVVSAVETWVDEVASLAQSNEQYKAAPDLWERLGQNKEFLAGQPGEDLDNTPFTSGEQAAISAQLKQIRNYITTAHELTTEQISHLDARLEHAEEASRRIGRKDWLMAFNGAVFSLFLTDLITPDTAQHVIMMAVHGLGHLFGIGGPPPHLPG